MSQLGTTALRQAKVISKNILSRSKTKFPHVLNNTITKIGSVFVAAVGLTKKRCDQLKIESISASNTKTVRAKYYPSASKIRVKLTCSKDGTVLGGQIIGDEEVVGRINTIALAIQKGSNIKDLAKLETCYNPASAPVIDPITIAAETCKKKMDRIKGM